MYPTKEEILQHLQPPKPDDVDIVRQWKQEHYKNSWRHKTPQEKIISLDRLMRGLVPQEVKERVVPVLAEQWAVATRQGDPNIYFMMDTNSPSIISCLHEIGHVRHGSSELIACTFSVALFKECFPKEMARLEWKGHMLVRKAKSWA